MKILVVFVLLIIIYYYSVSRKTNQLDKSVVISTLLRQTGRWAVAAEQDKNELIALLHANYSVGYFSALKEIVSDDDIRSYGGVNSNEIMRMIQSVQDGVTTKISQACPSIVPDSKFVRLAWYS